MSFRELRNFIETMKALGYTRLISVENFRQPNFELVASVLYWLVHRYDPTSELSPAIGTENERVEFLKNVANIMFQKAQIKLNIKQLYRADGYAVKELLKISSVLYEALNTHFEDDGSTSSEVNVGSRLEELKEARQFASEIVDSGAKLYTLLGREEECKPNREKALTFIDSLSMDIASNDNHASIERNIREQVKIIEDNAQELEKLTQELDKDEKNLKLKIDRKKTDLERAEKRLMQLKKVKPAFMDEYEHLEAELKGVYETYLERFRNLQYLESELLHYHTVELEKKQESDRALHRMQKRLREEELRILRGETEVDENAIDDSVFESGKSDDDEEENEDEEGANKNKKNNQPINSRSRPKARGNERGGGGGARGNNSLANDLLNEEDEDEDEDDDDDILADNTGNRGGNNNNRGNNRPQAAQSRPQGPGSNNLGGVNDIGEDEEDDNDDLDGNLDQDDDDDDTAAIAPMGGNNNNNSAGSGNNAGNGGGSNVMNGVREESDGDEDDDDADGDGDDPEPDDAGAPREDDDLF